MFSPPVELRRELLDWEPYQGRPAVWTHRRIGGPPELLEDVAHLVQRQRVIRLDRRVAGHGGRDAPQRLFDAAAPQPFQVVGQRANRRLAFSRLEERGHGRQAHAIAAKLLDFEAGVNVALGLPIIRTSVDHGTAFDIAGKGIASTVSLIRALEFAAKLAGHHCDTTTS